MLVKMPHSNFKERSQEFDTGVGKRPCGQTFEYTSERDIKMKLGMHHRFCSNPPKTSLLLIVQICGPCIIVYKMVYFSIFVWTII